MNRRYDAVLFDLLTALLDSWSLWNAVAGSEQAGRRWRAAYLAITYRTGRYQPYEELVAAAAELVGLSAHLADELAARYGEIEPWPEVAERTRHAACSRRAAWRGHQLLRGTWTPRRKPHPGSIQRHRHRRTRGLLQTRAAAVSVALDELGVVAERCLFVAGSAYDLFGTARVGLPTWWHDRIGMTAPPDAPAPIAHHRTLAPLLAHALS